MSTPDVYQFHAWLRGISPMIWRRLRLRSDQTLADLHYTLQIAFGWSDFHLHRFRIHGKDFGVSRRGGPSFYQEAHQVRLAEFQFRPGERFLYEYDFGDGWEHQVRLERILPLPPQQIYPVCMGGKRSGPPEDCGGVAAFQQQRDQAPGRAQELWDQIADCVRAQDRLVLRDLLEEIPAAQTWLTVHPFDRREVNRKLRQYAVEETR
jgi:Plasmid pRiA4b ORF-3-like protein